MARPTARKGQGYQLIQVNNLIRPWIIVLMVCTLYLGVILGLYQCDPTAFAVVGTHFMQGDPAGTQGYDGQFAYYIALDPLGASEKLDVPAYRYQRILYPVLCRWLALGHPGWVPWAMVAVNLVALVAGTAIVEALLHQYKVSRWYALVYGLYAGLMMSVRLDLNEPLSYALALVGMWAFERRRTGWSAVLFSLAVLAKETALLAAGAYVVNLFLAGRRRLAFNFSLVVTAPFLIWQLILWRWLSSVGIGSGGAMATPFEVIPLMGLWRIGAVSLEALLLYAIVLGPLVILPTMWGLMVSGREILQRQWHPFVLLLFIQAATILFLPHSSWREFLAMLRLSIGLVVSVLLYAAMRRNKRALKFSFGWLAALAFLFKEGAGV